MVSMNRWFQCDNYKTCAGKSFRYFTFHEYVLRSERPFAKVICYTYDNTQRKMLLETTTYCGNYE